MFRIAILSDEKQPAHDIERSLAERGFICLAVANEKETQYQAAGHPTWYCSTLTGRPVTPASGSYRRPSSGKGGYR